MPTALLPCLGLRCPPLDPASVWPVAPDQYASLPSIYQPLSNTPKEEDGRKGRRVGGGSKNSLIPVSLKCQGGMSSGCLPRPSLGPSV